MTTTEGARLEKAGNLQGALDWYVLSGEWDHAARVALSLNRGKEAGTYYLQAARPYDAAVCFQKAGALAECLEALKQVTPASPRYRSACVHMIRVAEMLGRPLVNLSSRLVAFISTRRSRRRRPRPSTRSRRRTPRPTRRGWPARSTARCSRPSRTTPRPRPGSRS